MSNVLIVLSLYTDFYVMGMAMAAVPSGSHSVMQQNYQSKNNPPPDDSWYYSDKNGKVQGPFSTERMRKWWIRGKLSPDLWVKPAPNAGFPLIFENKGYAPIKQLYVNPDVAFSN